MVENEELKGAQRLMLDVDCLTLLSESTQNNITTKEKYTKPVTVCDRSFLSSFR